MLYYRTFLLYRTLAWWLECSPMAREIFVKSQVESCQRLKNWYLMPPCLTLRIIKYGPRVKWSNPRKGIAPSPIRWCSSNWKGSLQVTHDYGRQLYLQNLSFVPDIGMMVWVFANGPGDLGSIPGRVIPKTQKIVLDAPLLNTQHNKVRIKSIVKQSRERSSALPNTSV